MIGGRVLSKKIRIISFIATLVALSQSCGTFAGNPDKGSNGSSDLIRFFIADAPVDDALHVYIPIAGLEISSNDADWVNLPSNAGVVDLLQYQRGDSLEIASANDLVGTYKARLSLDPLKEPSIVLADSTEWDLSIPSGDQTGLKIVTPIEFKEGEPVSFTIDFDLRKSISSIGNEHSKKDTRFKMKPVLRLLKTSKIGSIAGIAAENSLVCVYETAATKDETIDCENALNTDRTVDGKYLVSNLEEGSYSIRIFSAEGEILNDIDSVEVKAGQTKTTTAP